MNLMSCPACGVVLDVERVSFPCEHEIYKADGEVDLTKAQWDGDKYSPSTYCPVCKCTLIKGQ